jgi:hypothetical protein
VKRSARQGLVPATPAAPVAPAAVASDLQTTHSRSCLAWPARLLCWAPPGAACLPASVPACQRACLPASVRACVSARAQQLGCDTSLCRRSTKPSPP